MKRRRCCVLLTAILALNLSPASAGPAAGWRRTPGAALSARSRLRVAAELLGSGSLASAILAAAGLDGRSPSTIPSGTRHPTFALPAAIAPAVGQLTTTVAAADRLLRSFPDEEIRALADPVRVQRLVSTVSPGSPGREGDRSKFERLLRVRREYQASSYVRALEGAAFRISEALDRALPRLQIAASTWPEAPVPEPGCEVAFQPPVLCIGGSGQNSYAQDFAVLIDLGGNDVYTNSAGGADPTGNGLPVSVVLDLGGNDTYRSETPTPSGSHVAQGGGWTGGVGMLVDVSGDDTYQITGLPEGPGAYGQGAGSLGVGVFADFGGSDTHLIVGDLSAGQTAQGLGAGTIGTGLAIDRGSSNDTYDLRAHTPLRMENGKPSPGYPLTVGFGAAAIGAGILYDDGGDDTVTLDSATAHIDAEEPSSTAPNGAAVTGMGYGGLGQGIMLSGPGAATRTMRALDSAPQQISSLINPTTGEPQPSVTGIRGMGVGFGESLGAALDLDTSSSDDDTNVVQAIVRAVDRTVLDDACGCTKAAAQAIPSEVEVWAMGRALNFFDTQPAVGLLEDGAGDDRYDLSMVVDTQAVARDERTSLPSPPKPGDGARAIAGTHDPFGYFLLTGQGYGAHGGEGILTDHSGNDSYRVDADVSIRAEASARLAESPAWAEARLLLAQAFGQGIGLNLGSGFLHDAGGDDVYDIGTDVRVDAVAPPVSPAQLTQAFADAVHGVGTGGQGSGASDGYGELIDIDGADRYSGIATYSLSAQPATSASPAAFTPFFQASAENEGVAFLSDMGAGADSFQTLPPDPACLGTRGTGIWKDCGTASAIGVNVLGEPSHGGGANRAIRLRPWTWGVVQVGTAHFLDAGGTDTFASDPVWPICAGTKRGEGTWVDCGIGFGIGSNL